MKKLITDPKLHKILNKVEAGERLSFDDGITLYNSDDILSIGQMANIIRERKNGNKAYYNINHHIDYSNICILHARCHFCAYSRKNLQEEGAFELSVDEFLQKAKYALENGCTEIHSVGGLHPTLPLQYYLELLRRLKEMMPQVHLKFLTAVEIHHIARIAKLSVHETLFKLKQSGLDFIPGGGAEIFAEETRNKICPGKLSGEGWLDVMRQAHRLGIRSNATMLFGHIETIEDRVDHLIRLRELQDETGGFMAFVPLPFHPVNTQMSHLSEPTGLTNLKNIAVSRLMLDNFDHIKAYWVMLGIKLAQVALSFGADDMHGTVTEEKITHAAGAETPKAMPVEGIVRLIKEAGRIPIERDTFYNEIIRGQEGMKNSECGARNAEFRVGAVPYLNAKPLIYTLQDDSKVQLRSAVPSRLADQLQAGQLDVALIPAIEYFRKKNYRIIPNISISSHSAVRSVKLFSKMPIEKLQRVALDTSSRTSSALLKILLAEKYGLNPQYTSYNHRSEIRDTNADAVLLIGDAAMQQSDAGLYTLDLGAEWHEMTKMPFVYALWVAKEEIELKDLPQKLQQAKKEGLKLISKIAQIEAPKLNLSESLCREYLRQNIGYDLNESELSGLRLFYNYALKLGLAKPGIEIAFA